mmetsp:Transcript_25164/g.37619  ORF Transcript_25164/g.37619 Transcript_25164/m.37619 type:complete len:80 (-) Transcript_25164:1-240(-)
MGDPEAARSSESGSMFWMHFSSKIKYTDVFFYKTSVNGLLLPTMNEKHSIYRDSSVILAQFFILSLRAFPPFKSGTVRT